MRRIGAVTLAFVLMLVVVAVASAAPPPSNTYTATFSCSKKVESAFVQFVLQDTQGGGDLIGTIGLRCTRGNYIRVPITLQQPAGWVQLVTWTMTDYRDGRTADCLAVPFPFASQPPSSGPLPYRDDCSSHYGSLNSRLVVR